MLKKILAAAGSGVLLAAVTALAGWWYLTAFASSPADPKASGQVVVVPAGSGANAVARMLASRKIIDSAFNFKLLFYLKNRTSHIKAGEYHLAAAMSPAEIIDTLIQGNVILHRLTIPEGYTLKQIAELVEASGIMAPGESFFQAATATDLLSSLGIAADSAEGYLFPETYFFPAGVPARDVVAALLARFYSVFSQEWVKRSGELGFSVHQIVTLASIIEKETAVPQERPLIASVFHNRLKRGMRLESDPTVIYGLADFDGNLTRAHLNNPTPYNTYRVRGLPPGPIANPGRASLEAALYPAESAFLYFVATGRGTHFFSADFSDHQQAVRKFQLRR